MISAIWKAKELQKYKLHQAKAVGYKVKCHLGYKTSLR